MFRQVCYTGDYGYGGLVEADFAVPDVTTAVITTSLTGTHTEKRH